jgi:hypothetical protein
MRSRKRVRQVLPADVPVAADALLPPDPAILPTAGDLELPAPVRLALTAGWNRVADSRRSASVIDGRG